MGAFYFKIEETSLTQPRASSEKFSWEPTEKRPKNSKKRPKK